MVYDLSSYRVTCSTLGRLLRKRGAMEETMNKRFPSDNVGTVVDNDGWSVISQNTSARVYSIGVSYGFILANKHPKNGWITV